MLLLKGYKQVTAYIMAVNKLTSKCLGFKPLLTLFLFLATSVLSLSSVSQSAEEDQTEPDTSQLLFDFETGTQDWTGQTDWVNTSSLYTSSRWTQSGDYALQGIIDASEAGSYAMQVLVDGIDVTAYDTLSVFVNTEVPQSNLRARLFVKHGEDYTWVEATSTQVEHGGTRLELNLSGISVVKGLGVLFEGFEQGSSYSVFYLDTVMLETEVVVPDPGSDGVLYDFETGIQGWIGQTDWVNASRLYTSSRWAQSGDYALQGIIDASEADNYVMQANVDGIDVTEYDTLSVSVNTGVPQSDLHARLFVKHGEDYIWVDTAPTLVEHGGTRLQLDLSGINVIHSLGVLFEGFEQGSSYSVFYLDAVTLEAETVVVPDPDPVSDGILYDFETDTQGWIGQTDWINASNLYTSSRWAENGDYALQGIIDASEAGNYIMQVFVDDIDVTGYDTLSVYVNTEVPESSLQARLFVRHGEDYTWVDATPTLVESGGTRLELDLSDISVIHSLGVLFEGFDQGSSHTLFYLDAVALETKTVVVPDSDPVVVPDPVSDLDNVLYNFETDTQGWVAQTDWVNPSNLSTSDRWTQSGEYALKGIIDASEAGNYVMQVVVDGIDVTAYDTLSAYINTEVPQNGLLARLFVRHGEDYTWVEASPTLAAHGGARLELDLSGISVIHSLGVLFEGYNQGSSYSVFYLDAVTLEVASEN